MAYTLGTAAVACGVSKSTVHRAIKSGKISAQRHPDGSYTIDPAEMHRVFPPLSSVPKLGSVEQTLERSVTPADTVELAIRNASLEAQLKGLQELLGVYKGQVDDLRSERDRLITQVDISQRLLTHSSKPSFFDRFKRSA
jgi:hypothetical protein